MKIKRPTLTGPVRYLGHFAREKVLRDGHNTNGKYKRIEEYDAENARNDSDPGPRGSALSFMRDAPGTMDKPAFAGLQYPDDKMVHNPGEHTGEMNHPKNMERRRRKTSM